MYKIVITNHFKKSLKRLVKKDKALKATLKSTLETFNRKGAISIGSGIFKLRVARVGKGKSKGYRIYIFVMEIEGILTPLHIYEKNDTENISNKELLTHLELVKNELHSQLN